MRKSLRKPQTIYSATTVLWLIGMLAHCTWRTYAALSGPPSPDLYANHLSFQLVTFLVFLAPAWLIGLLVVLVVEFAVFGRKPNHSSKRTREKPR
ncbi:hypothetical protein, partial [Rhodanobacter sp. 115]|uniref:hypothetical protein n=1 Tax=Rhodanobacter sp. FW021-MT20 TaxID=1162282 RepID=UPI000260ECB9